MAGLVVGYNDAALICHDRVRCEEMVLVEETDLLIVGVVRSSIWWHSWHAGAAARGADMELMSPGQDSVGQT